MCPSKTVQTIAVVALVINLVVPLAETRGDYALS
jgi:hypothetical protein